MHMGERCTEEEREQKLHPLSNMNPLAHLGEYLPAHITDTVLPLVADEMSSGAVELSAQVDGTRQLLLQSAALRRSTVLAPLLKQQLVTRAIQLQRRRAQLVQQLQRQVRHWRSTPPGVGATSMASGGQASRRGGLRSGSATAEPAHTGQGALRATWNALQEAFRFEEDRAHLVLEPLCPSTAALRALLMEVVTGAQRGLHRRVVEQVSGARSHHGQSPTTACPSSVPVGDCTEGDRDAAQGGSGGSAGPEDAIETALQLLLRQTRQTRAAEQRVGRVSTRGRAPRSGASSPIAASSAPLTGGTASQVSTLDHHPQTVYLPGVYDVDVYSDDVEEQTQDAEEDVLANSQIFQQQPRDVTTTFEARDSRIASQTAHTSSPGAAAAAGEEVLGNASMWLRVPGILTLGEYCAELPWVADLAGQRYTEARERKKHSGSGGSGEVGYISRHIQPGEQASSESVEGKEARYEAGYVAPTPTALQTMPPVGYLFSPALAGGSVGSTGSGGESVIGRALRHNAGDTTGAPRAAPADLRTDREGAASAQGEERSWLARVVVKCISDAVDAAWQSVDESVVAPFCAHRLRALSSSVHPGEGGLAAPPAVGTPQGGGEGPNNDDDDEEMVITQFMEILRVRYAVELAARVLAARHATELLLDSEDSVIFAETRLEAFVVGGGSFEVGERRGSREATVAAASQQASPSPAPVLTCTVLSLPGMQEIFYVVAYCTGAALLSDVALATSAAGHGVGSRQDAAGGFQRQGYLVVDVDAEEGEEGELQKEGPFLQPVNYAADSSRVTFSPFTGQRVDLANEEDPVAQQQASLQAWAALFEGEHLVSGHCTAASGVAPWSTSAASNHSSLSLAPYYRLWLYLWEYVLVVAERTSSSTYSSPSGDAAGRGGRSITRRDDGSQRSRQDPQGPRHHRNQGSFGSAQLPVAPHTARRWMEKVIHAAVMRGCAEAGLLVRCSPPAGLGYDPMSCLQMHLSPGQAERLLKATTLQARHALLQVSGGGGSE
ncbi:hypothetical protein JKF63_05639 [Porcisia hertigi]|uniref:Uncharacterized protein n=1 Tax=Porcisia hertigi TaxID=2761500 RepID=A0A836ITW9_9TRYP|nr:hypothetical protein JKF63_05639 [Porcisia hertigi]